MPNCSKKEEVYVNKFHMSFLQNTPSTQIFVQREHHVCMFIVCPFKKANFHLGGLKPQIWMHIVMSIWQIMEGNGHDDTQRAW